MAEMEELSDHFGEFWVEMERFEYRAEEKDLGAVALVLDLAKVFERVSLLVVWAWQRISACQGRSCECSSKDVWRSQSRRSCQGESEVACFCALCCRTHRVIATKMYPPLKLRVFVDDVTALFDGDEQGSDRAMAKKVMRHF